MPTGLNLVDTLSDLVAIPSVNPMGQPVSGPEYFEYRVTDYLEQLFARLGLPHERQPVDGNRHNIVARLDGSVPINDGGQLILFEAHQDTVPVAGMSIDPWNPVVSDGRLYGRGACDIKGGMSAMLGAMARLAAERPLNMPTIVMACTVNEEFGATGALALSKLWAQGRSIIPRRPDVAVIAEPTGLDVVVAHNGTVRWRCIARGRSAHSSKPELGDSAIFRMGRFLAAVELYQRDVVRGLAEHALCGRPRLNVGTVHGGLSVNTVPDRCTIEIDRRLVPGEQPQTAYRHVVEFLAAHSSETMIEHEPPMMVCGALDNRDNGPLAERLIRAAEEIVPECHQIGVAYGTDAAAISAAGVPAVVFGPGSIEQAHTADEWLAIDQLEMASEILYRFASSGLSATA